MPVYRPCLRLLLPVLLLWALAIAGCRTYYISVYGDLPTIDVEVNSDKEQAVTSGPIGLNP